jgi:hypothetical protein
VGFVVDKVALDRFFPVSFIPPVLHYIKIIFVTGLLNSICCGALKKTAFQWR